MKKNSVKRLTLCAALCGAALTIFVIEAQIPLPLPIPGLKLGLANIITLFALVYLSPREALMILVGRIILGSVFTSSLSILLYSLSAGIGCILAEKLLLKILSDRFIIEISIVGAITHNVTQVLCAALIMKSKYVFWYLPPLIICAIFTGTFCGLCVKFVYKRLNSK